MREIQQSETTPAALELNFLLVDDADGKTPLTTISWAAADLKIKKAGGAFANFAGSAPTHTENGVWVYVLTTAEVNTLGEGCAKVFKTGVREFVRTFEVVGYQPRVAYATATALATVQADTDDIQNRIPAALVSGRIDASVGAIAAAAITSSAIATDAITSNGLAATAASEIADATWNATRAGHATAGTFGEGVASVQGNVTGSVGSVTGAVGSVTGAVGSVTGNVGGNVVGTVASVVGAVGSVTGNVGGNVVGSVASVSGNVGGNVTGSVGSVAANGITAGSIAAAAITAAKFATDAIDANALAGSAVTEIQSGLATSASQTTILAALAAINADTDDIQGRLPATLNAGNMRASVEVMQANTVNANAVAADAGVELAAAVDVTLTAAHGSGAWNGGGGGGGDPNAVLQALLVPNALPGSLARGVLSVLARLNGYMRIDSYNYVNGRPTGLRIQTFRSQADATAGTPVLDTVLVTAVNGPDGPTFYQAVTQDP